MINPDPDPDPNPAACFINEDQVDSILDQFLSKFEPKLLENRDIVTHDIQQKLRAGVVGFRIDIESIKGKMKLGQQRSEDDQKGVVQGLEATSAVGSDELLNFMHKHNLGLGNSRAGK